MMRAAVRLLDSTVRDWKWEASMYEGDLNHSWSDYYATATIKAGGNNRKASVAVDARLCSACMAR